MAPTNQRLSRRVFLGVLGALPLAFAVPTSLDGLVSTTLTVPWSGAVPSVGSLLMWDSGEVVRLVGWYADGRATLKRGVS